MVPALSRGRGYSGRATARLERRRAPIREYKPTMRCKSCQYPLWNLTARVCPECGEPFRPSDFTFALNSVRFMCPHCSQPYYGTSEQGHLVPPEFDCVRCGRHIHMDQMVLLPTEGVAEERTRPEGSPWLERKDKGAVAGWFTTVWWALFQPTRLMRSTPMGSSTASAAWFALLTNGAFFALDVMLLGALILFTSFLSGFGGGGSGIEFVVMLAGWFVGLIAMIGLWTLLAHGILLITGQTAGGMGRTAQAICYASAANVITSVPCLGVYLSPIALIWWAIAATFMTIEGQRVSGWRAFLAVAGPPLVLVTVLVAGFIWMLVGLSAMVSSAQVAIAQNPSILAAARPIQTQTVLDSLLAFGLNHDGKAPDHVARLVLSGQLMPDTFLAGGSGTAISGPTVGGLPLITLPGAGDAGTAAVDRAAAGLPQGTVAYRLGDYVFTYPGIDLSRGDPGLWIVVCAPDQAAPGTNRIAGATVPVGRLGGTVTPIASTAFSAALAEQNALRAQYGLLPLPDPALVSEGQPAIGAK